MQRTLIIFAKEPAPGRTKTRLCPPLDSVTAAVLYGCFLRDVLELARRLDDVRRVVAYTPETAGPFFAQLAPDLLAWPQRGGDLGERLDMMLSDGLRAGASAESRYGQALAIGSDSPNVPLEYLRAAFERLDAGVDVVLGPSEDGGYYLIGLRAPQPRLLREVPMSTPTVLADTLALARTLELCVELLPAWYDVDTIDDLRRLEADLGDAPPGTASNTRAFLACHPTPPA